MQFLLPELGEGVVEAELSRWLIKEGDVVRPGQGLVEMLTDKANMEVPAPFAGSIKRLLFNAGDVVKVGKPIFEYETADASAAIKEPIPASDKPAKASAPAEPEARAAKRNGVKTKSPATVKAAPSVRLMAQKMGIDLAQIHGSGPQGRILIEDLASRIAAVPAAKPSAPAGPKMSFGTPGSKMPFTGLRRKTADVMVQAKQTIPHFAYVDECDVSDLVKLRAMLRDSFARKNAKLTYLPFFVKATVAALKEVPIANSSLNSESNEIVLHDRYHIGIAVAAPTGLLVPVIRDANRKSLLELAQEIERLSDEARSGKAKLDDLKGATFTITSIGNMGGLFATPIILPPQVGIMAIGKITARPIFDDRGQVKSADMAYLSFSFDHRILDGAAAIAFGNALIRRLKQPGDLLVE
ncbi:MAG: dihydrolipoamide acetyltransferase family protein [Gemmataceae bacterium]